jgi:hypothetical protein
VNCSKYSASQFGAKAAKAEIGLSLAENQAHFKIQHLRQDSSQAVGDDELLCLMPAIRVAQQIAYALDTSRASSSSSRIRNGAYD